MIPLPEPYKTNSTGVNQNFELRSTLKHKVSVSFLIFQKLTETFFKWNLQVEVVTANTPYATNFKPIFMLQ